MLAKIYIQGVLYDGMCFFGHSLLEQVYCFSVKDRCIARISFAAFVKDADSLSHFTFCSKYFSLINPYVGV